MRLDGFGLFVNDMATMVRFYRDVLGFEIKEGENADNVYLVKDGTLFLLFGRKDFEKMTSIQVLCPHLIRLLLSSLYSLDVNLLLGISFSNIFSHSVSFLLVLLIVFLAVQKLF